MDTASITTRRSVLAMAALSALGAPISGGGPEAMSDPGRYAAWMGGISAMVGWGLSDLGAHLRASDMSDERWRVCVLGALAISKATRDVLQGTTPPADYWEAHRQFIAAVDTLVSAEPHLQDALLARNDAALEVSLAYLGEAVQLVSSARQGLPRYP